MAVEVGAKWGRREPELGGSGSATPGEHGSIGTETANHQWRDRAAP